MSPSEIAKEQNEDKPVVEDKPTSFSARGKTPTLSRMSREATPTFEGIPVTGDANQEPSKSSLKKVAPREKMLYRPTPPRSRSLSRATSPADDRELSDPTLPDFYKVSLKRIERGDSAPRELRPGASRSRGTTPTREAEPEFRRVALRRTPSRDDVTDEASMRESLKKMGVAENTEEWNGAFTSLTAINRSLSRRSSVSSQNLREPEWKGMRLKKTEIGQPSRSLPGSRQGSRASSPERIAARPPPPRAPKAPMASRDVSDCGAVKPADVEARKKPPKPAATKDALAVQHQKQKMRNFYGADEEFGDTKNALEKLKKKKAGSEESILEPRIVASPEEKENAEAEKGVARGREADDKDDIGSKFGTRKGLKRFTSSLENINLIGHQRMHLSVFSREFGSDVDLTRVGGGSEKRETKLEIDLGSEKEEWKKLKKAPSIDGLFQTQEINANYTFKMPTSDPQSESTTTA